MMIGKQGNLGLDLADPGPGILYANKQDLEGTTEDRLLETFRRCLALTAALTAEAEYPTDLKPRPGFWELSFNDRLETPNTDETDRQLRPAIEATIRRLFGSDDTLIREADPKRRYGFVIHAEGVPTLETIASRLQVDSLPLTPGTKRVQSPAIHLFPPFLAVQRSRLAAGVREPANPVAPNTRQIPDFELDELSVAELTANMESGAMTSASITELYLNRIAELDTMGPELRTVIETNPDALETARALDRERRTTRPRGPLHGIPVLLKDNINTADRMTTTAGSLALESSIPPRDAFITRQLRAAGAVILGKANLSEWANFRSRGSSSGWSARGGQCRNPYVLDYNPCGSQLGFCGRRLRKPRPVGHRKPKRTGPSCARLRETESSVVKPTVGLLSRSGIIPISESQDTAGPMTRTVADAALVLGALTGVDPNDQTTSASDGRSETDYLQFLDTGRLEGARIGVARNFNFDSAVWDVFEPEIQLMRDAGAEILDSADVPNMDRYGDTSFEVMLYEFKSGLNRYLKSLGPDAPVKTLAEIIEFNAANPERELPYFGQDILIEAQRMGPTSEPNYVNALENNRRFSRREGIDQVMAAYNLDAIVVPTGGPAWVTDHVNGDSGTGSSSRPAGCRGLSKRHCSDGVCPRAAPRHLVYPGAHGPNPLFWDWLSPMSRQAVTGGRHNS